MPNETTTSQYGPSAEADLDAGIIRRHVKIDAPIEVVWTTLTHPVEIERWWGHPAQFPDGMAPGALGTFEHVGHGLMPIRIETNEPPTTFAFRWGRTGDEEPGPHASLVTFTVEPAGTGTRVTVVEEGFTDFEGAELRAQMEGNVNGWNTVLDALAQDVLDRR